MTMHTIQAAGVVPYRYRQQNLEFLLVNHRHGHWEFPKGKLDARETTEQAAIRELAEETGLTANLHEGFYETISYTFFDRYTNQQAAKEVYFFLGHVTGEQQVAISHEHADFIWLSYEQAMTRISHRQAHTLLEKAYFFLRNDNP